MFRYLVLPFLISVPNVWTQNNQLEFDYLRIENGLPHSTINDFTQDSLGYLWFATDNGLAYYDNYRIKSYINNPIDSNSISCNQVYKLHVDPANRLWIGTKQSLDYYDTRTGIFKHFYMINMPLNEKVPVVEIFQENDSTILLGTDGGGVRYINTNTLCHNFLLPESIQKKTSDRISSILTDKLGRYWLGSLDSGIYIFNPKNIETDTNNQKLTRLLSTIGITNITKLTPDEFLIATYGNGLFKVNCTNLSIKPFRVDSATKNTIDYIFDLKKIDNMLLIGTDGEGLIQFDLNSKKSIKYRNNGTNTRSISNNVIRTVFVDKEKNMWLGHYQGGISFTRIKNEFKNLKFTPYKKHSLSHTHGRAILVDSSDRIWIGTDGGGLNIIENGQIFNQLNSNLNKIFTGSNPPRILSLCEDNNNNIWIGTYLDGLYIYNNKTNILKPFEYVYPDIELSHNDIRCISLDRKGNIWVGTNGGGINVFQPKNNTIKYFKRNTNKLNESLTLDWIHCIYEDKLGFIWIGTAYGLNVYDPLTETFRQYLSNSKDSTSLSGDFIYSINEDINNQIWIGTATGLNKYNRKTNNFKTYTQSDGLPSNIINSIIASDDGDIWLSTNNGISHFNIAHERFINYNTTDGIASNSFLTGASFSHNGIYYFGSTSGISYFNPKEIKDLDIEIPIILTDLKILNQSIKAGQEFNNRVLLKQNIAYTKAIEILKQENVITIDFTALTFSYFDKIEYEYRLLGFSDTWNQTAIKPSVSYTNLKSGNYTFQVRVKNIGKKQPIRNLEISILPPFYETWWFITLIMTFSGLITFSLIRLRIKNIKTQGDVIRQKYEIKKLASEKERIEFNNKINETEQRFRKDEINYKNSQLISTTLLLTQKNKKMNQVRNKVSAIMKETDNAIIKDKLKPIVEDINSEFIVEKDWNRFEAHFNEVHEDFIKRLKDKYPELSLPYLRLCACLKLNLSTKDIASLMNISSRGVEKSRSRLRKKLSIGVDVNLARFISKI